MGASSGDAVCIHYYNDVVIILFFFSILQALQSLHIDLSSASPSGSVLTTTTSLDCASPTYWTPAANMKDIGKGPGTGRSGSFRRPHPCSVPPQSVYKRVPQRNTSTSSTTLLYNAMSPLSPDDNESKIPVIQDGYLETDV